MTHQRAPQTWFIDGFNVLQGNFSFPAQKTLVQLCCQLLGIQQHLSITIVFDPTFKRLYDRPSFSAMDGRLHVMYATKRDARGKGAADEEIVSSVQGLIDAEVQLSEVQVFTSDRRLSQRLLELGLPAGNILDHCSFQGMLIQAIFPDFLELHCGNRWLRTFQG